MKNKKETEFFVFNYDDKDLKLLEESEKALNENLRRIMQFFNLSALSAKITVDFYPTLEQWISFIENFVFDGIVIGAVSADKNKKVR